MDLRTCSSPWLVSKATVASGAALDRDASCDALIVGAGITGALVAYEFARAGIETIVIDRRPFGTGSTAASTALLLYEIDQSLCGLATRFGAERAARVYRLCRDAVHQLGDIAAQLPDDVGHVRRPCLYAASKETDVAELRREHRARLDAGLTVSYLSSRDIEDRFSFSRPAGLLTFDAAEIDPFRFTLRLLESAGAAGARLYDQTAMASCTHGPAGCTLTTSQGHTITAKRIIFATGYETCEYVPLDRVRLLSTYAIATSPLTSFPGWWNRCLIWETARPYLYLRTTSEGRALIGGADDEGNDPEQRELRLPDKAAYLAGQLKKLFPELSFDIASRWAGVFGQTEDGLPFIGEQRDKPGLYFALGYGGNGITFSLIAARLLRDLFLGRHNGDAELFGFER